MVSENENDELSDENACHASLKVIFQRRPTFLTACTMDFHCSIKEYIECSL